jgi:transmembrane sensor
MALDDGSVVELNAGAKVEVKFTPQERHVRLVRGEALFTVAKNPTRPFIVNADKVAVRAVGTAFSVQLDRAEVSVLVTEGKVRLDDVGAVGAEGSPREISHLVAGQQAVVSTGAASGSAGSCQVRDFTPAEIERALAWQGLRLEFVDMPLRDVVAEFNRYNVRKLAVGDAATGNILVGGNFRADNLDSFVRLLDLGFGVTASPRGQEIVLWRRP